jgi:diacylglycerol O-acyltransferase
MKKLSFMDSSWFQLESPETPMHVGGLQIYTYPEDASEDYLKDLIKKMVDVNSVRFPFNVKLKMGLGGLSNQWIEDPKLDLDYHVSHLALPKPGKVRDLLVLVSQLHAQLMDRTRPLWETYVIEGLEGNRFVLYTKIHHSLIDGVAGMKLMQASLTKDKDDRDLPPPWAERPAGTEGKKPRKRPAKNADDIGTDGALVSAIVAQLSEQFGTMQGLGGVGKDIIKKLRNPDFAGSVAPYQAPKSILNQRIGRARRFAAQSYSLSRIKAIGKKNGATLNDVVMAMCGGALRSYLLEQNALPSEPLIANVPVSIRPADGASTGNAITTILGNLGTHEADPLIRLGIIKKSMTDEKKKLSRMSKSEILIYTILVNLPFTVGQVANIAGRFKPMYNVVISNVPGPSEALFYNGAELQANYPVSLLFNGQGINITLTSYQDRIDVGIIACRDTVPHVQRLLDFFEAALAELE